MTSSKQCDLCDLPVEQCAHGLARRQRRVAAKAKKKTVAAKTPTPAITQRLVTGKRREKLPEVLRGLPVIASTQEAPQVSRKCLKCGQPRFGRYNVCAACLRAEGGRECTRCGRLLRPPSGSKRARRCGTCSGKNAYTITTMGAPGLGERA